MPLSTNAARALREITKLERLRSRLCARGAGNFKAAKSSITKRINAIWKSLTKSESDEIMRDAVRKLDEGHKRELNS
jgi:hypothetical protein